MPQNNKRKPPELSQKQRDQLRSRNGEPPREKQTTLNTSEVQEGPKGSKPAARQASTSQNI